MINNIIYFLIAYGVLGIVITSVMEPLFLPFPLELIYIPVTLLNPKFAMFYTLILILSSTLGVVLGYFVGEKAGHKILSKLIPQKTLDKIQEKYNSNVYTTMISAMFIPIPYDVYVLSAGALRINFFKFVLATVIATSIRYLPQGLLMWLFGDKLLWIIRDYFWVVGLIIIITAIILSRGKKKTLSRYIKIRRYSRKNNRKYKKI